MIQNRLFQVKNVCCNSQSNHYKKCIAKKLQKIWIWNTKINKNYFKLHYQAIVIKIVWPWHKNRYIGQWDRMEIPEINIHTHTWLLIYNKGTKNKYGERIISLINGVGKGTATCKRKKLDPYLTSYTKINSKQVKDLKIKTWTHKTSWRKYR